jgi:phosphohistidine phosphatase
VGARHLHLLRHAKASSSEGDRDHDRPLAPRGRRASAAIADHLRAARVAPDLVLCSSAVRARETLDGIRAGLPDDVEVEIDDLLYGAATSTLLERLRQVPDDLGAVLVIGHNPAIGRLAAGLAGGGRPDALERLQTSYPAGGLATLRTEVPWRRLEPGAATLEAFVTPRELDRG